jgi:hypothetical protein
MVLRNAKTRLTACVTPSKRQILFLFWQFQIRNASATTRGELETTEKRHGIEQDEKHD